MVYRDDAEGDWVSRPLCTGRIWAANWPKSYQPLQKATLSICLMRTKVVGSSAICKSSLVDPVMSMDHQKDNADRLCRWHKKKKMKQKRALSRAHLNRWPLAPKSAVYHLGYSGISFFCSERGLKKLSTSASRIRVQTLHDHSSGVTLLPEWFIFAKFFPLQRFS